MSIRGERAQNLVDELLVRLGPYLPPGITVEMARHKKWLSLQRVEPGSERFGPFVVNPGHGERVIAHGGVVGVPGVGPWVPFLPKRLRVKLTVQDALETVLGVAYTDGPRDDIDFAVHVTVDGAWARASYLPPGGYDPADRVRLAPLATSFSHPKPT